ncbi:hypothetical protein [Paracoccus jeotgali]|uniref:hypothetical protein n=1 Tax=Paracoccus jeotgali TaxID=2065379 RepID=UPI0028ACCF35|nr:hypothetical protein [Paracoccus jeotgali]
MAETLSLAQLTGFFSALVATVAGVRVFMSGVDEVWTTARRYLFPQRRPTLLVLPTPAELAKYSMQSTAAAIQEEAESEITSRREREMKRQAQVRQRSERANGRIASIAFAFLAWFAIIGFRFAQTVMKGQ